LGDFLRKESGRKKERGASCGCLVTRMDLDHHLLAGKNSVNFRLVIERRKKR
jgi:hypothetical protein